MQKNNSDARATPWNIVKKKGTEKTFLLSEMVLDQLPPWWKIRVRVAEPRAPLLYKASHVRSRSRTCVVQRRKGVRYNSEGTIWYVVDLEGWNDLSFLRPQTFDTHPLWACVGPHVGGYFGSCGGWFLCTKRSSQVIVSCFQLCTAFLFLAQTDDAAPLGDCSQSRKTAPENVPSGPSRSGQCFQVRCREKRPIPPYKIVVTWHAENEVF